MRLEGLEARKFERTSLDSLLNRSIHAPALVRISVAHLSDRQTPLPSLLSDDVSREIFIVNLEEGLEGCASLAGWKVAFSKE